MKINYLQLAVLALPLIGCSTTGHKGDPETVMVTYHVKPGKEAEFHAVISSAWEVYCGERLVFKSPHIVVQDSENEGKPRFVEIFTWVSRSIPEHAPESVQTIWKQEESLCEKRGEHDGMEPLEVELLIPARK